MWCIILRETFHFLQSKPFSPMFCTTFFVLPKCFLYRSDITLIVMCTHYFATNMSFLVVKLKISTKLTIFNN